MTRTITAKFPGKCRLCGEPIPAGTQVAWDTETRKIQHVTCGVPTVAIADKPKAAFDPTPEQLHALDLFATGNSLAIEAGAGTGKTSTLILLARSTDRRGQYVAFNKAIVAESQEKMPGNVACSTAHSLAYRAVGAQFGTRLRQSRRMRSSDIATRLGIKPLTITVDERPKTLGVSFLGGLAMAAITRFCQSADLEPTHRHVPFVEGIDPMHDGVRSWDNNNIVAKWLEPALAKAWTDLTQLEGDLPFRHDHYLKLWHLSEPKIPADFILFDEAQDANPVMVAIVAAQKHAQLVWVGDSQQQIYTFTGAVNALANVPADAKAFLTQSFRFGQAVADEANRILDRLPDAELRLVGTDSITSTIGPVASPNAILTRTNAAAVRTVLTLQQAGQKVALVGGGDEVVRFAKAAQELMTDGHTDYPDLACFESWGEVQQYVEEDEQGGELRLLVKLVTDFGVPTILAALGNMLREQDADVIVSTAHKSKGREWHSVQLAGDFPESTSPDELRLLYVAVTRAKVNLDIEAIMLADASEDDEEE